MNPGFHIPRNLLSVLLICANLSFGKKYFVDSAHTGTSDGQSWQTAYSTIEPGLALMKPLDTLFIARGTYVPAGNPATQSAGFTLAQGITVMGGYAAGGASRNPNVNATVLSGDKGRDDLGTGAGYSIRGANFKHVLWYDTQSNPPITLFLDGITVAGGDAVSSGEDGGGLNVVFGKIRMKNCRFYGNRAVNGGAISGSIDSLFSDSGSFLGNQASALGGVLNSKGQYVSFKNAIFKSNAAVDGGAIKMEGHYLNLEGSNWQDQVVPGEGAAVNFRGDSVRIVGCLFQHLRALKPDDGSSNHPGGGAVNFTGHSLQILNSKFIDCKSAGLGGGVRFDGNSLAAAFNRFEGDSAANGGGILAYSDSVTMDSCQFIGNTGGEKGGGLSFGSAGIIRRALFQNNSAKTGGGIFGGTVRDSMVIVQSRFEGNHADSGGAAAFDYNWLVLDSCQIVSNAANKVGGGIFVTRSNELRLRNSTLQGNSAVFGGGVFDNSFAGIGAIAYNCRFTNNSAVNSGGAMMSAVYNNGYVDRCSFTSNSADTGSAIRMYSPYYSIRNSIFYKNQANTVGTLAGIRAQGNAPQAPYGPEVHSSLFYQNLAGYGSGGCYGITNNIAAPSVSGNIFWANSSPQFDSIRADQFQKNIVQGIQSDARGNFSADPQFVAPLSGDFRLRSNSPAINALGSNFVAPTWPLDFSGNPRLYGTSVDIGPNEYQGEPYSAPILLSSLDHLKLLPGKTLIVNLDSVDGGGNPLYVRYSGNPASLVFTVVSADTAVGVVYNPVEQTLAITPKPSFTTGQVRMMTLRVEVPARPDLSDQKNISLEMGSSGFDVRGASLVQDDMGVFIGEVKVTGNAYPMGFSASRIYLGALPAGANPSLLAGYPYLADIPLTEASLSIARGGFADPGAYDFRFNGASAKVFLPGNQATGLSLADWARTQSAFQSTGRLTFTLPVTDGFEPARLVPVSVACRFERPVTIMRVAENNPHSQLLQWTSFTRPLKSLALWVEPQGPGAGPAYSITVGPDSLNVNQIRVADLQDLRSYHYRLVAVDIAGNGGTSELTAQTPSDLYSLRGSFSGLWVARSAPMAVIVDHFENGTWKTLQSITIIDTADNDWVYSKAITGESYRATFKVPGFYSEPVRYQVTVNRASRSGLNFHLSAEPVVARDSVKVEQRLGSGNLVVTARTAKLFVDEQPTRLKLRWEGGFPSRKIDSQEFAVTAYHETALGSGRALWTIEIPRAQISGSILNRTSSFDRDVRYLSSEIVTTAFGIAEYRSGSFDYPHASSDRLMPFAAQLYAKPSSPWLGLPVAYTRDAVLPVAGGFGNPGVVAEVSMVPVQSGSADQRSFPIARVGKIDGADQTISMGPLDFGLANAIGETGETFGASVGMRFSATGQGAFMRAVAVSGNPMSWRLRLSRSGSYKPFVHLARKAESAGTIRLTRLPDSAVATFDIRAGDSGWVGAQVLTGNAAGVSAWTLASDARTPIWMDAFAVRQKTGYFSPAAPNRNLEQNPPEVEAGATAMTRGFQLSADQDYEARVILRDAFGNISDTSKIRFRTLDDAYSGTIVLQQDTATGSLRLTLPPSGQPGLTATLVKFTIGTQKYEIAVQVPVHDAAPTEVVILKSSIPSALRNALAFTRTPIYTQGEVVWQRSWAPSISETTQIQVSDCGGCAQCSQAKYDFWSTLGSVLVCTVDRTVQDWTAVVKDGVPFTWPGMEPMRRASQSYLVPNAPTWNNTRTTAHELDLRNSNLDSSGSGGSRRQMGGRIEIAWKPGSRCEDSSRMELPFNTRFTSQSGWILISPNFDASQMMQTGLWRPRPGNPGPVLQGTRQQWLDVKDASGLPRYGGFVPNVGDSITTAELFGSSLSTLPRLSMAVHVDSIEASRDSSPGEQWQVWMLPGVANGVSSSRIALGVDGHPIVNGEVALTGDSTVWVRGPKITLMAGDHNLDLFMLEDGIAVAGLALKKSNEVPGFTAASLPRWGQSGFDLRASLAGLPSGTDITVKSRALDRFGNASNWVEKHYKTLPNDLPPALLTIRPLDTLWQGFILTTTPAFEIALSQDYPDSLGLAVKFERAAGGLATDLPLPDITVESRNRWRLQVPAARSLPGYPAGDWITEANSYRLWVRPVKIAGDTGDATRLFFGIRNDSAAVPMQPSVLMRTFDYSNHLRFSWLQGLEIDSTTLVGDLALNLNASNTELPGQLILLRGATVGVLPLLDSSTGNVLTDSTGNRYFQKITSITGGTLDMALCPEAGECQAVKTVTVPLGKYMAELRLDSLHFLPTGSGLKLGIQGMKIRDDRGAWARASGDPALSTAVPLTTDGFTDSVYVHEDEFHIGRLAAAIHGSPGFSMTACRARFFTALTDSGPVHSVRMEGACGTCGPYLEYTVHDQATGDSAFARRDALSLPVELTAQGFSPYSMAFAGGARNTFVSTHPDTVGYGGLGLVLNQYAFDTTGVDVQNFDVILPRTVFPDSTNPAGAIIHGLRGLRVRVADTANGQLVFTGLGSPVAAPQPMTLHLAEGQDLRVSGAWGLVPGATTPTGVATLLAVHGDSLTLAQDGEEGAFASDSALRLGLDSLLLTQGKVTLLTATGRIDRSLKHSAEAKILLHAKVTTSWAGEGLHLDVGNNGRDSLLCLVGGWFNTTATPCLNGVFQLDDRLRLKALEGRYAFPNGSVEFTSRQTGGFGVVNVSGFSLRMQGGEARVVMQDPSFDWAELTESNGTAGATKNLISTEDVTADAGAGLMTLTAGAQIPKEFQSLSGFGGMAGFTHTVFDLQAERVSLGLKDAGATDEKEWVFKAKGGLVLGTAFENLGLMGARVQVDDLTLSKRMKGSGFVVNTIDASLNNDAHRFVMIPGHPWVEFLTAGGGLEYEFQKAPDGISDKPYQNQVSLENWTVGFTDQFPIADLQGLRLLIRSMKINADNGKIVALQASAEYTPPGGVLNFPGFSLTGVRLGLGSNDTGAYASLHFEKIQFGSDLYGPNTTEPGCSQDGKIYFNGKFSFNVCMDVTTRIPIFPVTNTVPDQEIYLVSGQDGEAPALLKIAFNSDGPIELGIDNIILKSKSAMPGTGEPLKLGITAKVGYDVANHHFTVDHFTGTDTFTTPKSMLDGPPLSVQLKGYSVGYGPATDPVEGKTGKLFTFKLLPSAELTTGTDCKLTLGGYAGLVINVDLDSPGAGLTPIWNAKGGVSCEVEGLKLDIEGFTFSDNKIGFEAAAISLDDAVAKARKYFGDDKPEKNPDLASQKPNLQAAGFSNISIGAYFKNWYFVKSGTAWNLEPGTVVPTFAGKIHFTVLDQGVDATVDFTGLFKRTPEIAFKQVTVKTNQTLGGYTIPTGFSLRINGESPYLHPRASLPRKVVLPLPKIQLGGVGLHDAEIEFGLSDDGKDNWYLRGQAGLALQGLVSDALAELELEEPSGENHSGLRKAHVVIRLAPGTRIPLGTTGFYIAGFEGAIYDGSAMPAGAIACDIGHLPNGLKLEAAMLLEFQQPDVANGDLGFWIHLQSLNLGINGELKMLKGVADAKACVALYRGGTAMHGKFQVEADEGLAMRGLFVVDIWSDATGGNLTSSASAELGLKRGSLFRSRWLKIPRSTKWFGGISTKMGKFDNEANGFTGGVRLLGKTWGVGVIGGDFKLGNVGKYRLKQAPLISAPLAKTAASSKTGLLKTAAAPAAVDAVPDLDYLSLGIKVSGDELIGIAAAVDSGGGLPDSDAANADFNTHNTWPENSLRILVHNLGGVPGYTRDDNDSHYVDIESGKSPARAEASENSLSRMWQNPIAHPDSDSLALAVPHMPAGRTREKYEYQVFAGLRPPEIKVFGSAGSDGQGEFITLNGTIDYFQRDPRILERGRIDSTGAYKLDTLFKLRHEFEFAMGLYAGEGNRGDTTEAAQYGINSVILLPSTADGAPTAKSWNEVPGVDYDATARTLTFHGVKVRPKVVDMGRYAFRVNVLTRDFSVVRSDDNGQPETRRTILPDNQADSVFAVAKDLPLPLMDNNGHEVILNATQAPILTPVAPFTATSGTLAKAPWSPDTTADGSQGADERRTVFLRWKHPLRSGPVGYRLMVMPTSCGTHCAEADKHQFEFGPSDHFEMTFPTLGNLVSRDSATAENGVRIGLDTFALAFGDSLANALNWFDQGEYAFTLTPEEGKWNAATQKVEILDRSDLALTATARLGVSNPGPNPARLSLALPAGDSTISGLPVYRLPRNVAKVLKLQLTAGSSTLPVSDTAWQYGETSALITDAPAGVSAKAMPFVGLERPYFGMRVTRAGLNQALNLRLRASSDSQTCGRAFTKHCLKDTCHEVERNEKAPCPEGVNSVLREKTPDGLYRVDLYALQALARENVGTAPAATVNTGFYVQVTAPQPVLRNIEPGFVRVDKADTLRISTSGVDTGAVKLGRYHLVFTDSAGTLLGDSLVRADKRGLVVIVDQRTFTPRIRNSIQAYVALSVDGLVSQKQPVDLVQVGQELECQEHEFSNRIERNNAMDYLGIYPRYAGMSRNRSLTSDSLVLRISQATELRDTKYEIGVRSLAPGGDTIMIPGYSFTREGVKFQLPDTLSPGRYRVTVISQNLSSFCFLKGAVTNILVYTKTKPTFSYSDPKLCITNASPYRRYWFQHLGHIPEWTRLGTNEKCIDVEKSDRVRLVTTDLDGNNPDTTLVPIVRPVRLDIVDGHGQPLGDTIDLGHVAGPIVIVNPESQGLPSTTKHPVNAVNCYRLNQEDPVCGEPSIRLRPSDRGILAIYVEYRPYDGSPSWMGPIRYIVLTGPVIAPLGGQYFSLAMDINPPLGPVPDVLLPRDSAFASAKSAWNAALDVNALRALGVGGAPQDKWLVADSLHQRDAGLGLTADTFTVSLGAIRDTVLPGAGTVIGGRLGQAKRLLSGAAISESILHYLPAYSGEFTFQTWLRLGSAQNAGVLRFTALDGMEINLSVLPQGRLRLRIASDSGFSLPGVLTPQTWQHVGLVCRRQGTDWRWQALVNGIVVLDRTWPLTRVNPFSGGTLTLLEALGESLDYELPRLRPQAVAAEALALTYRAERTRRDALIATHLPPELTWKRDVREGDAWRGDDTRTVLSGIDPALLSGQLITLPNRPLTGATGDYVLTLPGPLELHALLAPDASTAQPWISAFVPTLGGAYLQDAATGSLAAARHYLLRSATNITLRIPKNTFATDLPALVYKPDVKVPSVRITLVTPGPTSSVGMAAGDLPYPDREDTIRSAPSTWNNAVFIHLPFAQRADSSREALRFKLLDRAVAHVLVPASFITSGAWYMQAPWRRLGALPANTFSDSLPRIEFAATFAPGTVVLPGLVRGVSGLPATQMIAFVDPPENTCLIVDVDGEWGRTDCLPISAGAPAYLDGGAKLASLPKAIQGSQAVVSFQSPSLDSACFTLTQSADVLVGLPENAALPRILQTADSSLGAFAPLYTTLQTSDGTVYRLYHRGAISGRLCLDLQPLPRPAPLVFAKTLPVLLDTASPAPALLTVGVSPYPDRPDVKVIAVPGPLQGAVVLPALSTPLRCDTLSLSLAGPSEAFVAFDAAESEAFALYLASQGWSPLADSLVLTGFGAKRGYAVYHRFNPAGGVQVPGRGCFESAPGSSQWILALRPLPGISFGLRSEDVHAVLMGETRSARSHSYHVKHLDVSLTRPTAMANSRYQLTLHGGISPIKPLGRLDTMQVWSPWLDTLVNAPNGQPVRIRRSALLPDLMPVWVDADSVRVSALNLRISGEIRVQVKNQSDAAAYRRFAIVVYQDVNGDYRYEAGVDNVLSRAIVMGLAANEEATYALPLSGLALMPDQTFLALADADDFIAETQEDNNQTASLSVCEKARRDAVMEVAADSLWVSAHAGIKAPVFFQVADAETQVAFARHDSLAVQGVVSDQNRFTPVAWTSLDTLTVRDVFGDGKPEYMLPDGVVGNSGQVLLNARSCSDAQHAIDDSLHFDFDGDGGYDTISCEAGHVTVRRDDGTVLATLGGSEAGIPHTLTAIRETAAAGPCLDLSLSYARLDSVAGALQAARFTLRLANAGETAASKPLAWQLSYLGGAGWVPLGISSSLSGLAAGQYLDVPQEVMLPNAALGPGTRFKAELLGVRPQREIQDSNNTLEFTWPDTP